MLLHAVLQDVLGTKGKMLPSLTPPAQSPAFLPPYVHCPETHSALIQKSI